MESLVRASEVAGIFRVSPQTVRNWVRHKRMPSIRVGRHILFRKGDVENFLEQNLRPAEVPDGQ